MEPSGRAPREQARRLVLGFNAGCSACSGLAGRIEEAVGDRLEVRSLHDPSVAHWREVALGKDAPWAPTLIESKDGKVRAWTGTFMGIRLGRALGPIATWRVLQALGSSRTVSTDEPAADEGSSAVDGISRGQFLKGLGGAAAALSIISGAGLPSAALARENPSTSGGTRAQRANVEKVVRSSKRFRELQRKLGRKFDFKRARFVFDEGLKVAAVAVPTAVVNGSGAAATFFVELQSQEVSYYRHLVSRTGENGGYVVTAYENGESLGRTTVGTDYVETPDGRRFTRAQFREEARKLDRARRREHQEVVTAQGRCSRCRRARYNYCTWVVTTSCIVGGFLNPWAGAICAYVYWYGTTIADGCASWARVVCYRNGACR